MTQAALRLLLEQVNQDRVSLEDLHLAVASWRMSNEERQPAYQEVYERLWPAASSK